MEPRPESEIEYYVAAGMSPQIRHEIRAGSAHRSGPTAARPVRKLSRVTNRERLTGERTECLRASGKLIGLFLDRYD